jgi:hypothetical protein
MSRGRASRRSSNIGRLNHSLFGDKARSLTPGTDHGLVKIVALQPLSDLDLKIASGWGDTPQTDIPADWRTNPKPAKAKAG